MSIKTHLTQEDSQVFPFLADCFSHFSKNNVMLHTFGLIYLLKKFLPSKSVRGSNLFVDLVGVGQFAVDWGTVQWWDGHGLHGDKLDFVGESPACICGPRHPIDVFKDGGRGQLVCAVHRGRT